jgi:hypothetical protein
MVFGKNKDKNSMVTQNWITKARNKYYEYSNKRFLSNIRYENILCISKVPKQLTYQWLIP